MKKAFAGAKQCYVVSVSPWQKKRALESPIFSGVQQRCIMNGIDASIFYEKRFLKEDDWRTVLFVTADFSTTDKYSKGGFYLLELARLLKNEKIRFEVVGRTASKKVEEDNVRIIGPVHDKNELADFYCKADVALALSQRETYGMTVAEALLCGTPVVGFKNGGSESIALSNHTQFVEFGDVKKLADIIRNKWIDYKDIHSNQIALEAEYMYSDKAMATAYENLYLEVIK
ncbi:glycosyltransferase [Faecalibacterium prausnitzii]|uniref:glycosyltransferase n=1 Tax=Faecalibacterium prausnitzii TaxID=853 RepID=UPI002665E93C|nr:glycosyltransferase [Faecalibacterium prausnitzii]